MSDKSRYSSSSDKSDLDSQIVLDLLKESFASTANNLYKKYWVTWFWRWASYCFPLSKRLYLLPNIALPYWAQEMYPSLASQVSENFMHITSYYSTCVFSYDRNDKSQATCSSPFPVLLPSCVSASPSLRLPTLSWISQHSSLQSKFWKRLYTSYHYNID